MQSTLSVHRGDGNVVHMTPTVINYKPGEYEAGGPGTVVQEGTATVTDKEGSPVDEKTAEEVLAKTLVKEDAQEAQTNFKGPISTFEAIRAYQRYHAMAAEKREISKAQKEEKATVDAYLENNPEGFKVFLTDAKDRTHEYLIDHKKSTRITLLKDVLAAKIGIATNEVSPSAIAEAVQNGIIDVNDVRALEDLSDSITIRKTKIKKPKKKGAGK